ncbi:MAG: tripartite tricarboxylate transporter substrate binding protein [Deltaproteobacteria bacterium]|nr:tripartite tricarboxylate transporter substrate binding protein [Deltaproteobacteria bacterium]
MNKKRALWMVLFVATAVVFATGTALAKDWKPTKAIEIIAPAGPGGGWDMLARTVQKALTDEKLVDKPIIVTNKPGGGGATGWTYLKGKKGHGEYLAATSPLILQNNLLGKSELTYNDVTPIACLMAEWETIAVKADAPWKTGKEFFEAIKKNPASVPVGVGPTLGNDDHIQFLTIAQAFNVDPKTVKFVVFPKTAAEQIPAILGGHIGAITISMAETLEQVKAGKLRLLGVSSPERLAVIPDVPTWKEQGIDLVFPHWRGLIAAPGLTDEQLKYWDTVIGKMVQTKTWKDLLKKLDWDSFYQNAADHKVFLAESYKSQDNLLTSVGLKK